MTNQDTDPLFQQSLTPVNVIRKIREDILVFLGLSNREESQLSPLEGRFISILEQVLRKGACPSSIHEDPEMVGILEALLKVFGNEEVYIEDRENWQSYPVFETLLSEARKAHAQKMRIDMLRTLIPSPEHNIQFQAVELELDNLRTQKAESALMFQRIIFSHASQLREDDPPRTLALVTGKDRLDALLDL
jgi:hypothetical protein